MEKSDTPGSRPPRTREEAVAVTAARLGLLTAGTDVFEVRAKDVRAQYGRPYVEAGYFDRDHLTQAADAALRLTDHARAVYVTLNALRADILARCCNRTQRAEEGQLTKDADVIRRLWLYIDIDPVRDALVSATDAEKAEARQVAEAVRDHLR